MVSHNMTGFPGGVAGYDLCPQVQEQAARFGAEFQLTEVERSNDSAPKAQGAETAAGRPAPWRSAQPRGAERLPMSFR